MKEERKPGIEDEIDMRPPVYTEPPSTAQLLADVYETARGDAYVLEIPVPGLRPDEIVIEADVYSLKVSSEPSNAPRDIVNLPNATFRTPHNRSGR
jgi:HSP20 family molecular chaperone IbpA